jgi:PadR family transcriptional regulator, regulatory protein AphA
MDIRTLCLGVLSFGPASGYEIKKQVERVFGSFFDASFGSIYPALNALTREGLVSCTAQVQEKRPDKKVYRLTESGRYTLVGDLTASSVRDRFRSEFLVAMLFAELLPAARVSRLIDERLTLFRRELQELDAEHRADASPAERFISGFSHTVYSAALRYLEDNRHIVEAQALLAREAEPAE